MHPLLADARLYLVTDVIAPPRLQAALDGGVDVVQLRMKQTPDDAAVLREAAWMRAACTAAGVPFLLNDRPDLAREAGADGVHVGQEDASVAAARAVVGHAAIVGLSTHAPAQHDDAPGGVDYLAVGPVWATPTKPGRPAAGLEYVRYAARHAYPARPWFAIGGIDAANVHEVVAAGARRVVVVRAITEAADPAVAAHALKSALLEASVGIT